MCTSSLSSSPSFLLPFFFIIIVLFIFFVRFWNPPDVFPPPLSSSSSVVVPTLSVVSVNRFARSRMNFSCTGTSPRLTRASNASALQVSTSFLSILSSLFDGRIISRRAVRRSFVSLSKCAVFGELLGKLNTKSAFY